jgi:hypothetical protein
MEVKGTPQDADRTRLWSRIPTTRADSLIILSALSGEPGLGTTLARARIEPVHLDTVNILDASLALPPGGNDACLVARSTSFLLRVHVM